MELGRPLQKLEDSGRRPVRLADRSPHLEPLRDGVCQPGEGGQEHQHGGDRDLLANQHGVAEKAQSDRQGCAVEQGGRGAELGLGDDSPEIRLAKTVQVLVESLAVVVLRGVNPHSPQ